MDNSITIDKHQLDVIGFEDEKPLKIDSNKIIRPDYNKIAQRNTSQYLDANWKTASGAIAVAALSNSLNIAKTVLYLGREITIWTNVTVATVGFGAVVLLGGKLINQLTNIKKHLFLRTLTEIGITVIAAAAINCIMLSIGSGIPLTTVVYAGAGIGVALYLATQIICLIIRYAYLKSIWGKFNNHDIISLKLPKSIRHVELFENFIPLIGSSRIYIQGKKILCLNDELYVDVTNHPFFVKNKEKIIKFLNQQILQLNKTNVYDFEKNRIEKSIAIWSHIASN